MNHASASRPTGARPMAAPHPKLLPVIDRARKTAELAVERVVANYLDAKAHPLPRDPRSVERVLKQELDKLPAARRPPPGHHHPSAATHPRQQGGPRRAGRAG